MKAIAHIFTHALTVSEILRGDMFDLQNLGQCNDQHSRRSHLMANIIIYNSRTLQFFASIHRFPGMSISNFMTLKR